MVLGYKRGDTKLLGSSNKLCYNTCMSDELQKVKEKISQNKNYLKKTYGVEEIGIFGSYAHGEDTPLSDIDVLFDVNQRRDSFSLFDLADMQNFLENLLGKSVDVIDKNNIRPLIKERILKEVILI